MRVTGSSPTETAVLNPPPPLLNRAVHTLTKRRQHIIARLKTASAVEFIQICTLGAWTSQRDYGNELKCSQILRARTLPRAENSIKDS